MSRIVILGQSLGVFELVQQLKNLQSSAEITIFSLDGQIPHNQALLSDYLAKKISKDQVYSADKDFYKANNIELVLDQKLERVSLRQKKLTTESKEHIKFDTLVIADAPEYRWPDVKGVQKQGVYHVRSLGAADKICQQLPFIKSIVIQIYDWNDIKTALALKEWGKEVAVVLPYETRIARLLEHDVCEAIMKTFQQETWNVYYGQSIAEVLGDSETKAVRLSSGKVLAADMVIMGQVEPRLRIFEDFTGDASAIEVNADFQSSAANVYAFGEAADRSGENTRYWGLTSVDWKYQAQLLASRLAGQMDQPQTAETTSFTFDLENWSVKVLGDVTPAANMVTFRLWNAETRVYQKMFTRNGKITGAVLINLPDAAKYEYLLVEKISVMGREKHVFDVALGLEDLKTLLASPLPEEVEEELEPVDAPAQEQQVQTAEGLISHNS